MLETIAYIDIERQRETRVWCSECCLSAVWRVGGRRRPQSRRSRGARVGPRSCASVAEALREALVPRYTTHIESTLNSTRARPRARSFIFETSLVRATRHGRSPPTCLHTREKERKASKAASAGQCSAAQRGAAEGRFEHRLLPAIIPPSLGAALGHARSWPALGLQARAPEPP